MRRPPIPGRALLAWLALSAVPVLWLEIVRFIAGAPFDWIGLVIRWAFTAALLLVSRWTQPGTSDETGFEWPWPEVLAIGLGGLVTLLYAASQATWVAWVMLAAFYLLLFGLEQGLASTGIRGWRWAMRGLLVLLAGGVPTAIVQIESRFSEEEFFVALQAVALAVFWVLLVAVRRLLFRKDPGSVRRGVRLHRRWLGVSLFLLTFAGLVVTIRAYQHSFYPTQARTYEGISTDTPFLCGQVSPDPQTYDGEQVFRGLLARIAANPRAGPPEYAMLALGTGEYHWAQAFRESLLNEAQEGRFTDPAHSVKSMQYLAARRAYYLPRVQGAFPSLFSDDDLAQLQSWFAAVNHRALTVEAVDWMYALAFAKCPEGPYENQEIGAGLLALLEAEGLSPRELSPHNQDYLERNPRGWLARFRNTDDALAYQPEWIDNAYFQSLYAKKPTGDRVRLSLEWLLLQALPDGAPIGYNLPYDASLTGVAYAAAQWLQDPRYVWLAGRALAYSEAQGRFLTAKPGAEQAVSQTGHSPTQGSCLLYGDSGLPNQIGPLAPDKIVLRDGWSEESAYLLLNLRFTGWHRYKATNTVTLVYQSAPLAADVLGDEAFGWLPEGRSLFRDKRIPRENLNGLVIPRTGMSAVLYSLGGVGGPWAQDPPYYADVISFETGNDLDSSHTRLSDWQGWQHDRWIYLYHSGGPIIVADSAEGPPGSRAALMWHLVGDGIVEGQRIRLSGQEQRAEILVLAVENSDDSIHVTKEPGDVSGQRVVYHAPPGGELRLVTVFLTGQWIGAEARLDAEKRVLELTREGAGITLSLPFED